jgi:hypothetical protein
VGKDLAALIATEDAARFSGYYHDLKMKSSLYSISLQGIKTRRRSPMYSLSFGQFQSLTGQKRKLPAMSANAQKQGEKVLLPNQRRTQAPADKHTRQLTTCSRCDAVVDAAIVHPWTHLCPLCRAECNYW